MTTTSRSSFTFPIGKPTALLASAGNRAHRAIGSAALASTGLARAVRRLLPFVVRLGGVLLIASGLYLIAYWLPVLSGGLPNERLASLSTDPSNRLSSFLDRNVGAFAFLSGLLVTMGAVFAVARWRRRRDHSPEPTDGCGTPQTAPTVPGTLSTSPASSTVPGDFAALETEEVPPAHGDLHPHVDSAIGGPSGRRG